MLFKSMLPFRNGVSSFKMELFLEEQFFSKKKADPRLVVKQNENDRVTSPKSVHIYIHDLILYQHSNLHVANSIFELEASFLYGSTVLLQNRDQT